MATAATKENQSESLVVLRLTRGTKTALARAFWKPGVGLTSPFLVLLSLVLGFGTWELVGHFSSRYVFASFSDTMAAFWRLLLDGTLLRHARVTFYEVGVGFALGAGIGLVGGALSAFSRVFRRMTDHWVTIFLGLPYAAVFPIFLVWFGLGAESKIALAVLASFVTIWFQTYAGVMSVDRELAEVPRAFGGSRRQVLRWVVLPWSLPFIIEGFRLGLSRAFIAVIVGELLAGQAGLGYFIGLSGNTLRMDNLLAGVVLITGITVALVEIMKLVQRMAVPWWSQRG